MKLPMIIQKALQHIRYRLFHISPETILRIEFRIRTGYSLNIKNPKTYCEKLQWLKLYWRDPKAVICADKYEVRGYLKEKGLGHLLNELYYVFEDVDEINYLELPEKFVLKVTHGSGQNIICRNKGSLNWEKERKKIKKWLGRSQFFYSYEWMYKEIKPRIIVERLIENPTGGELVDYKVFCFDGKPKYIYVVSDRGKNTIRYEFFDLDWRYVATDGILLNNRKLLEKPKHLDELIMYAKILSEGFPHVRVDFYVEEGRVFFGECTFFHGSGMEKFHPIDFDYKLGGYLRLPVQ